MNDGKRLKRGLKDISPLFGQEIKQEREITVKTAQPIQSLAVFCPHDAAQNLYLTSKFAQRIKAVGGECVLLSIGGEKTGISDKLFNADAGRLKRFQLTLDQLDAACRYNSQAESFGSSVFLFDFDYANPLQFKKIIPMLDKWVIFLRPELESLTETFKFLKASLALNHTLEYFVVCEGAMNAQKAENLYEKFSEIVSRRIGITLNWLGSYNSTSPQSFSGISIEPLQLTSALDTLEKRALAGWVYPELRVKE